jgi:Ca2+-binding EF-hand superfamily protein
MNVTNRWIKGVAAMGLGLFAASLAEAQVAPPPPPGGQVPTGGAVAPPAGRQAPPPAAAARPGREGQGIDVPRRPGDIPGPIDSLQDWQDSLKLAFMAADQDHNGLISQQEATDAGNMLVGGLFFAADANGDGKVTQDEAREVRERVLRANPVLRFAVQRAKNAKDGQGNPGGEGTEPVNQVASLLDTDNDKALSAAEVRQAVASGVQTAFAAADTNRDGELSPTELNAAVYAMARAGVQAAYQAADKDNNGSLSKDEFTQALVEPAGAAFDILDANLDGQLTTEELQRATRVLASQFNSMTIPEAANSPERLIEEGRAPGEVAPQPDIRIPANNRAPGGAPAAPGRPPR